MSGALPNCEFFILTFTNPKKGTKEEYLELKGPRFSKYGMVWF